LKVSQHIVGEWSKRAVTERPAFMVTVQVVPLAVSQPLQVPKVEHSSGDAVSVMTVPWGIPETLHVEPQAVPPLLQLIPPALTVSNPAQSLTCTVSVCVVAPTGLKVAVTERAASMVAAQVVPIAMSQPLQYPKVELASGDAVSVIRVPGPILELQVEPQSIPPPVTAPDPLPLFCTVSAWAIALKVAVTRRAAFIVTVQVVALAESHRPQYAKVESTPGDAVSVTRLPGATPDTLHVEPQLIPPPLTVPNPLFCTVSV
jgi:hypothetical protein